MAPTIAPPTTFCTSLLRVVLRTFSTDASLVVAFTAIERPSTLSDTTSRPTRISSFAFSERFSSVTRTTAVAPAGITAPLLPRTVSATVAVKRSPTLCVFVHTRSFDVSVMLVPAGIVPSARSDEPVPGRAVLPPGVVAGVLGRVGAGRDAAGRGALGRGAGRGAAVTGAG